MPGRWRSGAPFQGFLDDMVVTLSLRKWGGRILCGFSGVAPYAPSNVQSQPWWNG
jgi:hypothetical protein